MSHCKKLPLILFLIVFLASLPVAAATFTVAKDGTGQYTTIQEAVNKAGPGDIVQVLDVAVYPEQVTIDSTKNNLTLTSRNPLAPNKPKIVWQDKINVGPKTAAEAKVEAMITFDRNGALRVLKARGVIIDGMGIDGGGVYPFGYNQIWAGGGQLWPLQHGNAALTLWIAGDVIVKNCDISNAYFGISFKDRNEGGIFANANPADIQPWNVVPLSGFGKTGNHLIEYSRVHNNSIGFFFESTWDLGSTLRYNLVYENHHPTDVIAAQVKQLTNEGSNQVSGTFMFKDHLLSPIAIYNNTFWHNYGIFIGNWRAGAHHLIFNNIFAAPFRFWGDDPSFQNPFHELSPKFVNRMHNCVFAAQNQKPSDYYVSIMNGMQVQASGPIPQGTPVSSPFPASADIRWLEPKFASIDPASANFLVPDWTDTLVQKYIKDKGWAASGVMDPDGTPADLGAVPAGGGRPADIVTIRPLEPVRISGTTAMLNFDVTQRVGKMAGPALKYFQYIRNVTFYPNAFGGNVAALAGSDIITIPAQPIAVGGNKLTVTIPAPGADMYYAFFELVAGGIGSDSKPFTSSVGFLPYRKLDYKFVVEVWDLTKTKQLTDVTVGDTVIIKIKAFKMDGQPFTNTVKPVAVDLSSGFPLYAPGNPLVPFTIPEGVTIVVDKLGVFTKVPLNTGGIEYIHATGKWNDGQKEQVFDGMSNGIKIHPGPPAVVVFQNPPSKTFGAAPPKVDPGTVFPGLLYVYDIYGNKVDKPAQVSLASLSPNTGDIIIGANIGAQAITTDSTGSGTFGVKVTNGKENQLFTITGNLPGKNTDSADLIVGKPRDKLWIFYSDTLGYDLATRLEGQVGDRLKIVVMAGKAPKLDSISNVTTSISLQGTPGLVFYDSPAAAAPSPHFMLTSGRVNIWVSSKDEINNGNVMALPDTLNTLQSSDRREQIYFTKPKFKIENAYYYADNGFGMVSRAEVYYKDSMPVVPDSVALHWPQVAPANRKVAKGAEIVMSPDKRHLTITPTAPFGPDITTGDAGAKLGVAYQKATLGVTENDSTGFTIQDSVGPLVMTAMVVERLGPGADTLYLTFSEAIQASSIPGLSLILIKNGTPSVLTVETPAVPAGAGGTAFKVAIDPNPVPPAEGDSLRINPPGPLMDAPGNKAHEKNRPVVIKKKPIPPGIMQAYYKDLNADGKVETVVYKFNKKVSIPDCIIGYDLGGPNKVDSIATSRISYIAGDSTLLLVNISGLMPILDEVKTNLGTMLTIVSYHSIPGVVQHPVADSAAPVAKIAEFYTGSPTSNQGREKDTLILTFSEAVAPVAGTQPFCLVRLSTPYHFTTDANPIIANEVGKFFVNRIGDLISFPKNGDSLWLDINAKVADNSGSAQTNPLNRRVLLEVKPIPWEPIVYPSSNPFKPDSLIADKDIPFKLGVALIVNTGSPLVDSTIMSATGRIYDGLGNLIVPATTFTPLEGKNKFYLIWNGRNQNGRSVGTGMYLAVVSVTKKDKNEVVPYKLKIGVKR